jgi:lipopolysaccharide transport system ATP-binding protein
MSGAVVQAEGLGKQYRIAHQRGRQPYLALRDVATQAIAHPIQWWRAQRGPTHEPFWALRDVSFAIQAGDVLGIIGRNGAGKSTLLKLLSRITEPTTGRITLEGRVASLLEVGTGFHPELTGRENVFLNGAILGMTRLEIGRKFDEIVAFAEIERFLDTPVKHYSSGMYMRLAFAVAAHLEPEVLVVDEVLAVGDAEFQKKCLGKMRDVSRGGRTVLFVSHNMAAIGTLTTRSIVLDQGRVVFDGPSGAAIEQYSILGKRAAASADPATRGRGVHATVVDARLVNADGSVAIHYTPGTPLQVEAMVETDGTAGLSLELLLVDASYYRLGMASSYQFHGQNIPAAAGRYRVVLDLAPLWLASGTYTIDALTSVANSNWDHHFRDAITFDVVASNPTGRPWDFQHALGYGSFALPCLHDPVFARVPPDSGGLDG